MASYLAKRIFFAALSLIGATILVFSLAHAKEDPINLFISEPRKQRRDALITFSAAATPIFGLSLVAVVPKKVLYKKPKQG